MIGSAKQSGNRVIVYNEKNKQIFSKTGILIGYTSSNVTIQNGNSTYVYNEKGKR